MKRALLLVAALSVLVVPATANAVTWKGTVIAKDTKRKALVTSISSGAVRTVRAPKAFRNARVGRMVSVSGARLPDGTYAAGKVRPAGRAKQVRFRGVIVKRIGKRILVSAGKSVFSVRLRGKFRASSTGGGGLEPGDEIVCRAKVRNGGLETKDEDVSEVGQVDKLDLEGIYLSTEGSVLSLAVVHRGLVKVNIPDGLDVPELAPGDEIALVVTVGEDGSFTLVSLENEDGGDEGDSGDDDGVDIDTGKGEFTVVGILQELSSTSVAVEVERHPEPVRCAIKEGTKLEGFNVGDLVKMYCKYRDGKFVLVELRSKHASVPGDGQPEFTVKGFIAFLEDVKVAVKVQGHDEPVYCKAYGQDLRGFAVGDFVEMSCKWDEGAQRYVVVSLRSEHGAIEDGKGEFTLQGVIIELYPGYKVGLEVAHHPSSVRCYMPSGMDLRGFAVGEAVEMHCHNDGKGFYIASISSASASWSDSETEMPWFTVEGVLKDVGADSIGVQVNKHSELVRCTFPAGTDFSGFAVGDVVEMHCHFHDGKFNLATLQSEHANLKLEE
ncbi:MAG: hypothetical protein M3R70_00855 [Actinomycetota bacterium]|nr:hypothetical protein [Actinomycetota bacterium]